MSDPRQPAPRHVRVLPVRPAVPIGERAPGGWRGLLALASLATVAIVPGAAMAAGSITVAAGAYCSYGSFCLYSGPDFTGQRVEYDREQLFCQDLRPALDVPSVLPDGARSVVNNTRTMTSGLGVKIYSQEGRVVLPTVGPGGEVRNVDDATARAMRTLCAYPRPTPAGPATDPPAGGVRPAR